MNTATLLSLDAITVDPDIQQRTAMNDDLIAEYAESIADWQKTAPMTVFHADDCYWLADGFHRHGAAAKAGMTEVYVEIRPGNKRDAIAFSLSANARHGARPTADDLRRAYQTAVDHGLCDPADAATVARLLACSERWARTLTEAARIHIRETQHAAILHHAEQGMTQRGIAQAMGISVGAVNAALSVQKRKAAETEQAPSNGQPAMPTSALVAETRRHLPPWQLAMLTRIDETAALNGRGAVASALRIWFEEVGREVEVAR